MKIYDFLLKQNIEYTVVSRNLQLVKSDFYYYM